MPVASPGCYASFPGLFYGSCIGVMHWTNAQTQAVAWGASVGLVVPGLLWEHCSCSQEPPHLLLGKACKGP